MSANDDAAAMDLEEIDAEMDMNAFGLEARNGAASLLANGTDNATPRQPLRRSDSASSASTTRLLEALEALSTESGHAMPPSLRSLLGQLQGDDQAMAGLFPFMQLLESHGSGGHPRFQRMLQSIDADAPAHVQLSGLSDLCESLSMSTEESLAVSGFTLDAFVPAILGLIRMPSTMDVLLMATRALASIFDLFSSVAIAKAMADPQFVESICAKLLEIEYMDVAEQAFQLLDRIVMCTASEAAGYRRTVIAANGFVALLQFLDFFPIDIQRTGARVVAGLCNGVTLESVEYVQVALPMIQNLLRSSDGELAQSGCKSFQYLSASPAFASSPDFATMVADEDTCEVFIQKLDTSVASDAPSPMPSTAVSSCASALSFLRAVLSSSHSDLAPRAATLRIARLPPVLNSLLKSRVVLDDAMLLHETLQLLLAVLPSTIDDAKSHESIQAFAAELMTSAIHVYEVSGRVDVRRDALQAIRLTTLLTMASSATSSPASLNRIVSFLVSILRPESRSQTSATAERVKTLRFGLQTVETILLNAPRTLSARAVLERFGVTAIIHKLAEVQDDQALAEIAQLAKALVGQGLKDEVATEIKAFVSAVQKLEAAVIATPESRGEALRIFREVCSDRVTSSNRDGLPWLTAHEVTTSRLTPVLQQVLRDTNARREFIDEFLVGESSCNRRDALHAMMTSLQYAIKANKHVFRVADPSSAKQWTTGSVVGDMDQLTMHLKVKVKIEDAAKASDSDTSFARNKRIVHDTVVLVEPLARIDTIEEFIAERLFGRRATFNSVEEDGDDTSEEAASGRLRQQRRSQRSDSGEGVDEEDEEEEDIEEEDEAVDAHDGDHEEGDELRSDRPQRQRRLQVLFGGVAMQHDLSVLEVILKGPNATPPSDLLTVWNGSPHEFTFRTLTKPSDREAERGIVADEETQDTDRVWDHLDVLKQLHLLLLAHPSASASPSPDELAVNKYVSLQVARALSQPVRVVTHSLPAWCFRVMTEFPFAVDYATRFDFLYATTSGPSRAIGYLCRTLWKKMASTEDPANSPPALASSVNGSRTSSSRASRRGQRGATRNATTALGNLSRMAKLPRLKVRVPRSRLLQSAMKLFTMYSGKKAIIEIEFLGEVGTGLGPTTEFYTLVCHELQAAHLKLWRNDKDVPTGSTEVEEGAEKETHGLQKNKQHKKQQEKDSPALPIRGHHRVAVYHCPSCKNLEIPRCAIHDVLLTHEKTEDHDSDSSNDEDTDAAGTSSPPGIPQCGKCLDARDWHSSFASCKSCGNSKTAISDTESTTVAAAASEDDDHTTSIATPCSLRWWILSEDEVQYLHKVYPRDSERLRHPVLQCTHCDAVNFPGTDSGILILDASGQRMVTRAGRRMYERDYRAVTKHVSPLCEGTPLKVLGVVLTRDTVETLVDCVKKSPELLESQVEALSYMRDMGVPQDDLAVVDAPFGLFPKPVIAPSPSSKPKLSSVKKIAAGHGTKLLLAPSPSVLTWFTFMGRFVAQALMDERLLNLPLSRAFLRAIRGETLVPDSSNDGHGVQRSLQYVAEIDPAIARSLRYLHDLTLLPSSSPPPSEIVDAMELSFTLISDASIELVAGGKQRPVTLDNLREYVYLTVRFLLHDTIEHQVDAFHAGFHAVAGHKFLHSFSLDELEALLADHVGGDSMWDRHGFELRASMVCDHGYTKDSRAIHDLVAVLCELPLDEQRLFVKFVTGANRLPLGGLAKLEPKLTVVRKVAEREGGMDALLPSASTCTNYLKLPEYSTRDVLKTRLRYCIYEGQGSFHLS